eukprot:TRINITY_DN9999_c0_g1_i1.p1 TRINITY_DN9999_c0_g1~~TRINITY_DN9999_c0_g1_i1.p1  ORF type:complete len:230 (-),score=43.15 TRINITY_DN9999_c0_g1_i1:275-964(-)
MCMDGNNPTSSSGSNPLGVTAAYSLGVEKHDQWSLDVAKRLDVDVNQLDCTVDDGTCKDPHCKFFKKCAGADDGNAQPDNVWTLSQLLQQTSRSDAADSTLLMKMDIEGSEWKIFELEKVATLRKFSQLIVEFHDLQASEKHGMYVKGMRKILDADFRVVHLHGNNNGGVYSVGGASIPMVIEVTFVRNGDELSAGCAAGQLYDKLDAPNKPEADELPMAKLESVPVEA